jgi:hypothetical protein
VRSTANDNKERSSLVTEHPAQQLAAQAAEAAAALQEFLNPLRKFNYPGVDDWPRDLTSSETAALLQQVRAAIDDLGACAESIAGKAAYEGPPRQHLREAGRLTGQATLEIQAAQTALGPSSSKPGSRAQPQPAARDFPAASSHSQQAGLATPPLAPGTPGRAPRRPEAGSRPDPPSR